MLLPSHLSLVSVLLQTLAYYSSVVLFSVLPVTPASSTRRTALLSRSGHFELSLVDILLLCV